MKLRLELDVPDGLPTGEVGTVTTALLRFAQAINHLGYVPAGPSPLLLAKNEWVGRAWIEPDTAEAAAK